MYLLWFRPYRRGDGIKRLLDTKSDELKPVFFKGMTVLHSVADLKQLFRIRIQILSGGPFQIRIRILPSDLFGSGSGSLIQIFVKFL